MNIWPFRRKQPKIVFVVVAYVPLVDDLFTLSAHKNEADAEKEVELIETYTPNLYKQVRIRPNRLYGKSSGPLTSLSQDQLKFRACN